MGYIIKIAGVVVMGWGVLQSIFFLVATSGMGTQFTNEFGEILYMNDTIGGAALFGFIGIIATHVLYGVLIIGFGEVIDLLQDIYFRLNPKAEEEWLQKQEEKMTLFSDEIPLWVEQDIKAFYKDSGETVDTIHHTNGRDVYKVTLGDRNEYIEMGGFQPKVLSEEEAQKYE